MPGRRWSWIAWLVFWVVLLIVLSVTRLVQAQEKPRELAPTDSSAPAAAEPEREWLPFVVQEGLATWYGPGFHGRRTASGRRFNMHELTAAHRWLPFGTLVRVSVPGRDTALVVQVTDRGPFVRGRVIDLSWAAARALDVRLHPVRVEAFLPPPDRQWVLGFGDGWRVAVLDRSALTLVDTMTEWTAAVRLWQTYRQRFPKAWLLATWAPEADRGEEAPLQRLWFHIGLPQQGADSLLSSRQ
jgi:predicted secreted protein